MNPVTIYTEAVEKALNSVSVFAMVHDGKTHSMNQETDKRAKAAISQATYNLIVALVGEDEPVPTSTTINHKYDNDITPLVVSNRNWLRHDILGKAKELKS